VNMSNRPCGQSAISPYQTSKQNIKSNTGTPPLTRFFGPWKNRVKGKPRYRRSILVLKPKNWEFICSKSTFLLVFTSVKLQLQSLHLYLSLKVKKDLMLGSIWYHFDLLIMYKSYTFVLLLRVVLVVF
jgi:hypothetical protein